MTTKNVCCPHYGEPQPAPDTGDDAWDQRQVKAFVFDSQRCAIFAYTEAG